MELAIGPGGGDWPAHVSVTIAAICAWAAMVVPACMLAVVAVNRLNRLAARRAWLVLLLLALAGAAAAAVPTTSEYPHLVKVQMGDPVRMTESFWEGQVMSPADYDNLTLAFTPSLWSSFWIYAVLAAAAFVAVTFPKLKFLTEPLAPAQPAAPSRPTEWFAKMVGAKKVLTGRAVRWTLLSLYVATILVLATIWLYGDWSFQPRPRAPYMIAMLIWLFSQGLFILTAAGGDLFRPLGRRRLVVPAVMAAFMMGILVIFMTSALSELFYWDPAGWFAELFFPAIWGIWAVAFFIYTRQSSRLGVLKRLVTVLVAGSLLETIVAAWAHAIVSRRPGCRLFFSDSAAAIIAGACVGLWAFGPGIAILFLHARAQQKMRRRHTATTSARRHGDDVRR